MIRRLAAAAGAAALTLVAARTLDRRLSKRLLEAPRTTPDEAGLGSALDVLGGEVVRLRARDGVRLAGRWLPAEGSDASWRPDPYEAILLLHGWTGSIVPDLVEHGPYLRRTAGVLGLDFRGHGASEAGPSTFGVLEVEDIAGALAWLGERGIRRVALVGSSMGGIAALAAVAVLGDGTLAAADMDPVAPRDVDAAPRPRILAVVGDSVTPELELPVAERMPGPARRLLARRMFDGMARTVGADPRATEPARIIGLVEPVPVLLIHGTGDRTVPIADGRRLAALAGPTAEHLEIPDADHAAGHRTDPGRYEARTTAFLRAAFQAGRDEVATPTA